jgi:hypothetical protein
MTQKMQKVKNHCTILWSTLFPTLFQSSSGTKVEVEMDLTMSEVVLVNAKAERLHRVKHM